MPKRILPHWVLIKITVSNNFMEIQMGGGGGGVSLNLEILREVGAQAVLEIQVEGEGKKTVPNPSWGCGFFLE